MKKKDSSIIKETGIVGGVQIIRLLTGLIRNKLIALCFGTQGVGIWAIFLSFSEMMQQASFMGMDKAGVKTISEHFENQRQQLIAIRVIRWSFLVNSLLVALGITVFSDYLDAKVFSTVGSGVSILIAVYLVFNCNALCTTSLLNGLREIKKYALSQLFGVLIGNLVVFCTLPFINLEYLPYCFIIIGVNNLGFALYFYLKLNIPQQSATWSELFSCYKSILSIGIGFWLPALYMAFIEYQIRQYLMTSLSVEMLGVYQACWTISNMYIGIILSSMGVALFPKLCQIIQDKNQVNKVINDQITLGLLISAPIILGVFIFSSELLFLLYSEEFVHGSSIIQWQMLGVAMRLLGFPFGYALMAKGKSKQYMISQFIFATINYILVVGVVEMYGESGLGINYLISYALYLVMMFIFCKKEIGFTFSAVLIKTVIYIVIFLSLSFFIVYLDSYIYRYTFGLFIIFSSIILVNSALKNNYSINAMEFINNKLRSKF
ncbi:oligosaccharide flippase family protein [Vibrio sp. WJH972]